MNGRTAGALLICSMGLIPVSIAHAQPPEEDIPEEVLRQQEIITEARSPIDGRPLSASEYAELQEERLLAEERTPQLSPEVREIIFLLQVRRTLRFIAPFLIP